MIQRLGSLLALDKEAKNEQHEQIELTEPMLRAREQIEYYMSMINMDHDDFFREKIEDSDDGCLDVSIFMNCNRIKQMQISADDVMTACSHSHFLSVDIERHRIGPATKYHKDVRRQQRIIRISGFDLDEDVNIIYSIVCDNLAEPENLLLQYKQDSSGDRIFTGVVLVLFFTEEAADEAVKREIFRGKKKLTIEKIGCYEERLKHEKRQPKTSK
jgi:hypothetical protein